MGWVPQPDDPDQCAWLRDMGFDAGGYAPADWTVDVTTDNGEQGGCMSYTMRNAEGVGRGYVVHEWWSTGQTRTIMHPPYPCEKPWTLLDLSMRPRLRTAY